MAPEAPEALTDQQLCDALRARGQRVTSQRLVIHQVLREAGRHVTADEVLDLVGERLPNISLPTVYSTLETLETLGAVRRVSTARGAALFDPRTDPHDHMVCERCGAVEDIETATELRGAITKARRRGFDARGAEVTIRGLCAGCAEVP